jgi:alanine dehydrogenase
MPGAVPNTATHALTNTTLSYALALADQGFTAAVAADPALRRGVNVADGTIWHPGVQAAFDSSGPARP